MQSDNEECFVEKGIRGILEEFSNRTGNSLSDTLWKCLALYNMALNVKDLDRKLAVLNADGEVLHLVAGYE